MKGQIVEVLTPTDSAITHQLLMLHIDPVGYCIAQVKSPHQLHQNDSLEGEFIAGATSRFFHTYSYPFHGQQRVLLEIELIASEEECRQLITRYLAPS